MEIDRQTHPFGLANAAGDMRGLTIWYAVYLVVSLLGPWPGRPADSNSGWVRTPVAILLFAVAIALADTMYRVALRVRARYPGLWACAPVIPIFNLVAPVILHGRLKQWLRERGVPVGLLGPTRQTARRLRAAADSAPAAHADGDSALA